MTEKEVTDKETVNKELTNQETTGKEVTEKEVAIEENVNTEIPNKKEEKSIMQVKNLVIKNQRMLLKLLKKKKQIKNVESNQEVNWRSR